MEEKLEKLIEELRAEWLKDGEEFTEEELIDAAKAEIGYKGEYTKSATKKKSPVKRERKIDDEKLFLISLLANCLADKEIMVNMENEVKLHFEYNNNPYTVTLTKHRVKKG